MTTHWLPSTNVLSSDVGKCKAKRRVHKMPICVSAAAKSHVHNNACNNVPLAVAQSADAQAVDLQGFVEEESQQDELVEQFENRLAATYVTPPEPMDLACTEEVLELSPKLYKDNCEAACTQTLASPNSVVASHSTVKYLTPTILCSAERVAAAIMSTSTEICFMLCTGTALALRAVNKQLDDA